jgi:hypothetical protein
MEATTEAEPLAERVPAVAESESQLWLALAVHESGEALELLSL